MITNQEVYRNEVDSIARKLYLEVVEAGNLTWDDICDAFYEDLPPIVSKHDFILFNHCRLDVIKYSDNPDAFFEVFGGKIEAESWVEVVDQVATWAFHQDVLDSFNDQVELWMLDLPKADQGSES
jgi:hypothetical protein